MASRGGPIFLLQMKDMQCCQANKYDIHAKKKKGKLKTSSPFKGGNGHYLVFYYTDKGIHIHLNQFVTIILLYNLSDDYLPPKKSWNSGWYKLGFPLRNLLLTHTT